MVDPVPPTRLPEPTCDFAPEEAAAELVRILDSYMADLQAGKAPSKAELLAQYPQQAAQLEACLAGLEFIHGTSSEGLGRQRLGDFQIIREVGRGGMGAVFEAEQLSLRRRVALKILRFGGVSDPDAIERFQREAETVAGLHHTNIVPIFAVGTERGVSYYAMQFIEGQSLAQLLAEAKQPLPADRVAGWGLQAAEALLHAHQRGVIHRDVKPSNLILDNDERLWLTDFGLARRLDDVTLSMTGAILGTPRYMSPEQAAASHKRIDHRTDLFSLGATLYELVTGRPAFSGDTPHKVIQHILASEPQPIRNVVQGVPRDLETIVMKCLAKEPHERYASATDLAADLRAFLEGRPIRARRAGPIELAVRWMKSQQRSFRLATAAVAITLLATLGGLLGWSSYAASRQATIKLDTNSPPLVAEILDQRDEVLRVETVPMQNPAALPAGDYRLRVSGERTLSQTFEISLDRGKEHSHTLDLHDQMLWAPRPIERGFDVVRFNNEAALVSWNTEGIALHKRRSPFLQWSIKFEPGRLPDANAGVGLRWPWNSLAEQYSGYGPYDTRPWVAPEATDIDGDGVGDLLIAARHQAWLIAMSGNSGQVLWFAGRGQELADKPEPARLDRRESITSGVVGTPIRHDCNGDGVHDVIGTLIDTGTQWQHTQSQITAKCWVEAFSGKTGESLWRYDLPAEWFELSDGEEVPYDLRWFAGLGGGSMSNGGGSISFGRHRSRDPGRPERTGAHAYRPAATDIITHAGKQSLAIVGGTHLVTVDPASGRAGEAVDLGARPGMQCQWADVAGDETTELVFLESIPPTGSGDAVPRLLVWSLEQGKALWSEKLQARWPQQPHWRVEAPRWPLLADLNGDGQSEIVVPTEQGNPAGKWAEVPWSELSVLAGDSGEPLWNRRLVTMDNQIDHFLAGPDLDDDGTRELFVATLEGSELRMHVDALSGRTGETLWHSFQSPPPSNNTSLEYYLMPLQWWQAGDDGWPQLAVQLMEANQGNSSLWTFSAANGDLQHTGRGMTSVRPADIDVDGVEDLLLYDSKSTTAFDLGGRLHCIRGVAREKWQRLDSLGEPAADFDGDGIRDLVRIAFSTYTATSGGTGKQLWASPPSVFRPESRLQPAGGDLNGDGTEDLLGWSEATSHGGAYEKLFALSGNSGRLLWNASEVTAHRVTSGNVESHDLDGDGQREVLWLSLIDHGYPARSSFSSQEKKQLWLFVLSGNTGKLRWSQPLSPAFGKAPDNRVVTDGVLPLWSLGDANGDGVQDVLVPELLPNIRSDGSYMATRVLNGKDGKTLWSRSCPAPADQQISLAHWIPPTAVDLDGNGRTEFVGLEMRIAGTPARPQQAIYQVVALEGDNGQERWTVSTGVPYGYWQPPTDVSKARLLRPRVLRAGHHQRVAMILGDESKLVVVEPDGQQQVRSVQRESLRSGVWPCDYDGDGVDEAAFLTSDGVCLAPANQLDEPVWKYPLGNGGQQKILQVIPGKKEQAPIVVIVDDGTDNSVLGLRAADGSVAWSCPGPIPRDGRDGVFMVPQQIALLASGNQAPPHVYYAYGSVARCRQTAGVPERITLKPLTHDDRWERDLPWVDRQDKASNMALTVGWSLLLSALLVVLPASYLGSLVWMRRFNLQTLLWMPVVAGLCLSAVVVKSPVQDNDFARLSSKLLIGLALAPVVISCSLLVLWSVRGKWRRIVVWLAISVLISAVLAMVFLQIAKRENPLLPEESYDWSYWYLIWFVGGFLTSWLMCVALPIQAVALAIWRRRKKPAAAVAIG